MEIINHVESLEFAVLGGVLFYRKCNRLQGMAGFKNEMLQKFPQHIAIIEKFGFEDPSQN